MAINIIAMIGGISVLKPHSGIPLIIHIKKKPIAHLRTGHISKIVRIERILGYVGFITV